MSRSQWVQRQLRDKYAASAVEEGWRSRAAFKLMQMNKRFKVIRQGSQIVDLGAAPGGWSQYVAWETNSQVQSKLSDNATHIFRVPKSAQYSRMSHGSQEILPPGLQFATQRVKHLPFLAIDGSSLSNEIIQEKGISVKEKKRKTRKMGIGDIAAAESEELQDAENLSEDSGSDTPRQRQPPGASKVCLTKTRLISVDMLPMQPVNGSIFICGDFNRTLVQDTVTKYLRRGKADVVLSDMSHHFVGDAATDATKQYQLSSLAFEYATKVLKRDGSLVIKVRHGCEDTNNLIDTLEKCFKHVERVKPDASRSESAEYFVVAKQFRRSSLSV